MLQLLLLNLIHEIKVPFIEMMDPDISILASAGVASPRGVDSDGIQGPEMAFDATDLVFEYSVVEARFEFALAGGCLGDFRGGLAATDDDEVFFRGDGCG